MAVSPHGNCAPIVALPAVGHQILKAAALPSAERGDPELPCNPDKSPDYSNGTLEHRHIDATTDLEVITEWWDRWLEALIGMPTGTRSGVWVLDEDQPETPSELSFQLPQTYTVATQRDGGGLSCSRRYAASLIAEGTIPSFKLGSLRRVRKSDVVDSYIEARLAEKD
jgi:excisionase family DNA binding protein